MYQSRGYLNFQFGQPRFGAVVRHHSTMAATQPAAISGRL